MAYRLAPRISIARADGALIILDIDGDRYFRLPPASERALSEHMVDPQPGRSTSLDRAISLGVLVFDAEITDPASWTFDGNVPASSLVDRVDTGSAKLADVVGVIWSLLVTHCRLRHLAFAIAIEGSDFIVEPRVGDVEKLAARFHRARRILPLRAKCLRDSLALRRWLARHGVPATLVIGVLGAPFTAHCWLQTQTLILDETSDTVRRFAPIWAVSR